MNILKAITGYRTVELPEVNASPILDRKYAFTCLNDDCRAIQKSANLGICQQCGSEEIISVDQLLARERNRIHQRMEEVREKKAKEKPQKLDPSEAIEKNAAAYFTDFRAA